MEKKKLSMLGFLFLTSSVLIEIYEYPTFATSGFSAIFYLLIGGFLWFLPVGLCAAEMATVDEFDNGGVYTWTSRTLGKRLGFAHIFYQFIVFTIGAVTMIYFIIGALSYVTGFTMLNSNPLIKFLAVILIFWIITFIQLRGIKETALITKLGFILGIAIPAIILFILTAIYLIKGNPVHIDISRKTFLPNFKNINSLVVLVSFMLSYMGIEVSATHVKDMKNPKRDYPRAIITLLVLAIVLSSLGALSVGIVIPKSSLSLNEGVFQTFSTLFNYIDHFHFLTTIIAVFLAIGSIAELSSWIIGPSRGLAVAGEEGMFPKFIAKRNDNDVASYILIIQGILVTIWAFILTFGGGSSNTSFFMAMTLTVIVYLAAYGLFFLAYINLVLKHKNLNRTYEAFKSNVLKLIMASVGFIFTIIALIISFIPPTSIKENNIHSYFVMLALVFIVVLILPFIITSKKLIKKYQNI